MWDKISDWWVHFRTRQGTGARWNGYRRQYPFDLQGMCDGEDEEGSPDGGEGEAAESIPPWLAYIKDPATSWEKFQMEEEAQWTIGPQKQWRMTMNKAEMQTSLNFVSSAFSDLDKVSFKDLTNKAVTIANAKLQDPINEWSLAIIMSAFCDAKVGQQPHNVAIYRESMMWMAVAALLKDDKTNRLPRVEKDIETVMNELNLVEQR